MRSWHTDIGSDEERREQGTECGFGRVWGEGGTPRTTSAGKCKEVEKGTQQRNNRLEQAFREICPPLKLANSMSCCGRGRGARNFAMALHDDRVTSATKLNTTNKLEVLLWYELQADNFRKNFYLPYHSHVNHGIWKNNKIEFCSKSPPKIKGGIFQPSHITCAYICLNLDLSGPSILWFFSISYSSTTYLSGSVHECHIKDQKHGLLKWKNAW
jgi:hypothetical protein